jgi:hypothetical protein
VFDSDVASILLDLSTVFVSPFDIHSLECEALVRLFQETALHIQDIRIEMVVDRGWCRGGEEHPAAVFGLTVREPLIQFAGSLDREQRIDVIAHELVHILLVYRYGLRMIDRRVPCRGGSRDPSSYLRDLNRHWNYLLEQTVNTIHHGILLDYLAEEYGIASGFHLALLQHNHRIVSGMRFPDRESQYARGLVAFEYDKRMGKIDGAISLSCQSEPFEKAYASAHKHFGSFDFHAIPSPSTYEEGVRSFLEDLGYQRQDFVFLPD